MLKIRPNCELCNRDLPAAATDAMICSFECTFCRDCVTQTLRGKCPNCGGAFQPRPVRPADMLDKFPASTKRVHHVER